jgi:hypothetical protein
MKAETMSSPYPALVLKAATMVAVAPSTRRQGRREGGKDGRGLHASFFLHTTKSSVKGNVVKRHDFLNSIGVQS